MMAGLFDDMPELEQFRNLIGPSPADKRGAAQNALLALGLGLMSNRSPYFGVALGNAGFGAMGAHQAAIDSARQGRQGDLQGALGLRKLKQEMEREARMRELFGGLPPDQRAMAELAPEKYVGAKMDAMFPKSEPYTLGKGQKRFGPAGNILAEVPDTPEQTKISQLWAEYEATPVGHPKRQILLDAIRKESSHAPGASFQVGLQAPTMIQNADGSYSMMQPTNKPGFPPQVSALPPGSKPLQSQESAKLPAEIGRMTIALDSLETGLDAYEAALKEFNPRSGDQFNPTKRAKIESLVADIKLQAKEAQALGALTGPDVAILDRVLADPATVRGGFYGRGGLGQQLGQVREATKRRRAALIKNYPSADRTPKQSQKSITVDY